MKFLPYKISQEKKPLFIYLPGMDGSGRLLESQRALYQNFEVRCLHFAHDRASDWHGLIKPLIELLEREVDKGNYSGIYLCGESFGACLALKLVEMIPHLFDRLILINSASSFYRRSWLNLGTLITSVIPETIYYGTTFILFPFLVKISAIAPLQRQILLDTLQSLHPHTVSNRIQLLDKFQLNFPKIKQFSKPVLIIASQEDSLLPSVEEAQRLKQFFSQSLIKILPHSGHCCLLEKKVNLQEIMHKYSFLH
ncbi:alpha/beta hydrolase [Cyanobacterium stanieri LEGE 03274]|uniref:Alpha/beta hydrolase n=1 Tax=Cyanobacterium stanieri LEGE 03274 TaxID=1828756 RepID=A0ABR9V039_9CHRO|nr:alpha/beta hydrolase [Cyanobacterium stanieri]MBE9221237.1 alpha/beta hydrolase [Cyanobacterium stanieri LEGE 03274]